MRRLRNPSQGKSGCRSFGICIWKHHPLQVMPITFRQPAFDMFRQATFEPQGAVGFSPREWVEKMGLEVAGLPALRETPMSRQEVWKVCQDPTIPSLFGYICAMAWGAQGKGPGGAKRVREAWNGRRDIEERLHCLRTADLSRAEAYNLFAGEKRIPFLGPAYFTKLLYFFGRPGCYIMDQWTTKSVILLTGQNLVRHNNSGPTHQNTGENYELFCRVIDDLAARLGQSGDEIEQRLFSVGAVRRQPRGDWRQHVHKTWEKRERLPRYNRRAVRAEFPELFQS